MCLKFIFGVLQSILKIGVRIFEFLLYMDIIKCFKARDIKNIIKCFFRQGILFANNFLMNVFCYCTFFDECFLLFYCLTCSKNGDTLIQIVQGSCLLLPSSKISATHTI